MSEQKKVFIFGGTGFLGYYSTLKFLSLGWHVDTLSLPDIPLGEWFPKEVGVKYGNLFESSVEEIRDILSDGYDAIVYAVGPDDRVVPKAPAYDFFHERLVVKPRNVFEGAKLAGVKKIVLLSSYFCYFDRIMPDIHLAEHHCYIKVRNEQSAMLKEVCGDEMDAVILELPYIFGSMPERMPLWKEVFIDRFKKLPAMYFPNGGTVMIHVQGIAESVVAATINAHTGHYPIGKVNVKFQDWLKVMNDCSGETKKVISVPCWMGKLGGWFVDHKFHKEGREGGLDHVKLMPDIQYRDFFYRDEDVKKVFEALKYDELGFTAVEASICDGIVDTMRAIFPDRYDENGNLKAEWVIPEKKHQYKGPKF